MSIRTVVTRGYASGGSVKLIVTRGYTQGAPAQSPTRDQYVGFILNQSRLLNR